MIGYTGRQRGRIAAAGAFLLLGLGGCAGSDASGNEAAEAAAEAEVVLEERDVVVAERSPIARSVSLTGTLDPWRVVEVRAQVPGTVRSLGADRGQAVRAGQVLAVIEAEGIRSQAAGAQAGVAAAEAAVALARRQLESAKLLHEAGAMSEINYRSAQTQYEAALAQLAAARAQAAGAGEAARRATVTAPIPGEVSKREVSEGEAVNPGQPLFTLVNTDYLELAGQVPVNEVAQVRPGQPVEFSLAAYPGRVFRGEVARVEPTADPATNQVGVYVRLPNRDRQLVGGLFATGRILAGERREAVTVPAAAVREERGQSFVWVVEGGVAQRRAVATAGRDEARGVVIIAQGLEGGERVIVAPGQIEDGTRVRLGGPSAAAPAAGEG